MYYDNSNTFEFLKPKLKLWIYEQSNQRNKFDHEIWFLRFVHLWVDVIFLQLFLYITVYDCFFNVLTLFFLTATNVDNRWRMIYVIIEKKNLVGGGHICANVFFLIFFSSLSKHNEELNDAREYKFRNNK